MAEYKKSVIQSLEVTKAYGNPINVEGVCYLNIENYTLFEVVVKDKFAGDIRVRAGKSVQFMSLNCLFDFFATVTFNGAAPDTDFITFHITSTKHGIETKEC